MRHTLTLDQDVDAKLAELCKISGKPFKQVENAVLRQGFAAREVAQKAEPLNFEPIYMGLKPGLSLVSISALESFLEEEAFR